MTDWGPILCRLFARKGSEELKASKVAKRAVKTAAEAGSGQPAEALQASLHAFLSRGRGGFRLDGNKVVKEAAAVEQAQQQAGRHNQKDKAGRKASEQQAAATADEAPAAEMRPKKKHKSHHKDEAVQPQEQHPQQAAAPPAAAAAVDGSVKQKKSKAGKHSGEHKQHLQEQQEQGVSEAVEAGVSKRKKKSHKRKPDEQQPDEQQHDEQQPDEQQCGQQERQQQGGDQAQPPAGARHKKTADKAGTAEAAAGTAAAAGAAVEGFSSGEAYDEGVAEMRWRENSKRQEVKSGPFSKAEKDTLRQAVVDYAAKNGFSTSEFSWLYGSTEKGKKGLRIWSKIAAALPLRTVKSVHAAGTRMFHEGNYQGKWDQEEDARLLELVRERGRKWKEIGGALGRLPESCRDRWLAIRLGDKQRSGRWDEEEAQRLVQAVNAYLASRGSAEAQTGSSEGQATLTLEDIEGGAQAAVDDNGCGSFRVSDRRIVLDDIDWNVISQAVGTRSNLQCLEKWYKELSPSMVARGDWGAGDDRRLLRSLYRSGAEHDFEVDWGQLVQGRNAAQARRRWRLMVKVLRDHRDLDFADQVSQLVEKYLPQLTEQALAGNSGGGGDSGEAAQG